MSPFDAIAVRQRAPSLPCCRAWGFRLAGPVAPAAPVHEYSLARALVELASREARARGASTVNRVTVRIGPLSGVEPELLMTAYGLLRAGTLCAEAELGLAGEDVVWRCDVCGHVLGPGTALCCPDCGLPARLAGGDALVLERIEMEVPSHV